MCPDNSRWTEAKWDPPKSCIPRFIYMNSPATSNRELAKIADLPMLVVGAAPVGLGPVEVPVPVPEAEVPAPVPEAGVPVPVADPLADPDPAAGGVKSAVTPGPGMAAVAAAVLNGLRSRDSAFKTSDITLNRS